MINSVDKKNCCGCAACAAACPKKCIEMRADGEGFLYPVVHLEQCIDCGKCERVCPVLRANERNAEPECYIGFSKDPDVRGKSSSGGIFTELANQVIENSGIVYGAGFDDNFDVYHRSVAKKEDIALLRGSKYVQSSIGRVYDEIKMLLQKGILVYFSGTPCQVAGLYAFLGKTPDNLITQDLICHGVGSPLVWEKYRSTYGNIKNAEFRNKKYGWHYFSMHIETEMKKIYKRLDEDAYLRLFLDNLILRPICYDCPIKKCGSQADITLADCWNSQKITDTVADYDQGLSLVIANTKKGKELIEKLKNESRTVLQSVDSQKALNSQLTLRQSVMLPQKRNNFFTDMETEDFPTVIKKWCSSPFSEKLRKKWVFVKTKIYFGLAKLKG